MIKVRFGVRYVTDLQVWMLMAWVVAIIGTMSCILMLKLLQI